MPPIEAPLSSRVSRAGGAIDSRCRAEPSSLRLPVGFASAAGRASRPVRRRSRRFAYPMFRDRHQLPENTRRRSDASPDRGRIIL